MLKGSILKSFYEEIYRRWDEVTPMPYDCGTVCGAACCHSPEDGTSVGMYLLPGEEKVHDKKDGWLEWSAQDAEDGGFPESWHGKVPFVACRGPECCKRDKRPVQCRSFPLVPHLTEEGDLVLVYDDTALTYVCPLIESEAALQEEFVRVTYENWKILMTDPLIADLVRAESDRRVNPVVVKWF